MSGATAVVASYDAASGRCRLRGPGRDETVPAAGVALHAAADPAAVYVGPGMIRLGGAILDALRPADRPAFWDVVRGGRWVDLDRAAFLLRLAGCPVPPADDPLDFGRRWAAAAAGPFGRLGIGLEVGHVLALNRVPAAGVHLADPGSLRDRLADDLRTRANARPWAHELEVRVRPNGTLSYKGAGESAWRDKLIDSLRDRHGVLVGRLDTRLPTVAVEHWPAWALAAPDAAAWRRLLGLNRLVRDLSAGRAVLRPEFGWLPDRAQDDHPAYVRDHLGAAGPGITAADFHPAAQVRRVSWDDLAARALADHLRRTHNGGAVASGELPPRVAVCLATGLDEPGASRLFGGGLPDGVFRPDALPPALTDHLADRALAAVLASGRFDGAAVAAGVGAAAAPGHALYLAFAAGGLTGFPFAARIRAALTVGEGRATKLTRLGNGFPAGTYHGLTRETVTLRSGRELGDLPWAAARTAEVLGEADEARRAVLVALARAGEVVVGFDDDGAWVAGESDAGQEVRTAADRYFRG